jgi:hypothetical protein
MRGFRAHAPLKQVSFHPYIDLKNPSAAKTFRGGELLQYLLRAGSLQVRWSTTTGTRTFAPRGAFFLKENPTLPISIIPTPQSRTRALCAHFTFWSHRLSFRPDQRNEPDTGAVPRYNISDKTLTNFVRSAAQGGSVGVRKTDPGSLECDPQN